jgi:predicted glycoside hydrolase/deacetylase ChbG (UPF0249 family)
VDFSSIDSRQVTGLSTNRIAAQRGAVIVAGMDRLVGRREFLKRSLGALGAVSVLPMLRASESSPRARLIVRGDDMGCSHSANVAAIKAYTEGIETTIEVIAPGPWFPEAARLLAEHPGVDVGIHLAITSEWDNVKWRPVSHCPSLADADGFFWPMVRPNPNYPARSIVENPWKIDDVEREFRAQIELGLKKIPRVSHVSGHMGCMSISPAVQSLADRLVKEYGIDIDLASFDVKRLGYSGPSKTLAEKTESFVKSLDGLAAGSTYCFVDHPGLDTPELRAISHIGYEDVAGDRQGVTDLWTDPRIRNEIERRGIQLISYRDLKPGATALSA